ncbi:MAG TPA: hypothetical protein VFO87_02900, partial [Nitrospira sp.]|nr:hypothetical protein [Nitrospira sp.]
IYTTVMSKAKADKAICDAGLKAQSVDSGMPTIFGRDDIKYIKCSDEHGVIDDPGNVLKLNEKLKLVAGHCDPTVNIYDWYVCVKERTCRSTLAGDGAWDESLAAFSLCGEGPSPWRDARPAASGIRGEHDG